MGSKISQRSTRIKEWTLAAVLTPRFGPLKETRAMADIQVDDGMIRIMNLDIQDPKAAAVLAAYPQVRWAEITRRAMKIGLGYLQGGEKD
jgi:hypothetical protein